MPKEILDNDLELDEAAFKSDDGVSEVPDVEFDKSAPKTKLDSYQVGSGSTNGKSKEEKNKDHESNVKYPPKKLEAGKVVWEDAEADEDAVVEEDSETDDISVSASDIDIAEDFNAIFGKDNTLSESFREKAGTVFKAAVVAVANKKLNEAKGRLEEAYAAEQEQFMEAVVDKLDAFLDKVVSEWAEENAPVLETNIRAEISESLMEGMRNLFSEHYIDIPTEQVDVVTELAEQVQNLEEKLDREIARNVELKEHAEEILREKLVLESADGLSAVEHEKLALLAEGVDFEDEDSFKEKVSDLKEAYFSKRKDYVISSVEADDEDPVTITEEVVDHSDPVAKQTAAALGKYFGKN